MYKTELCVNFAKSGKCPYRDHCKFAHGPEELRLGPREHDPRFKTTFCKHFWTTSGHRQSHAGCRFGKRCMFIHDETDEQLRRLWRDIAARRLWMGLEASDCAHAEAAPSPTPGDDTLSSGDDTLSSPDDGALSTPDDDAPPPPMVRTPSLEETTANMREMELQLSRLLLC